MKYFFFFFFFLVGTSSSKHFFSSLESYNAHVVICVVVFQYLWQQYGTLSSPSTPPTPVWGIVRFRRALAFTSFLVRQNNKQQQTKKRRRSRTPLRSSRWYGSAARERVFESGREPMLLLSWRQHLLSAGVVSSVCA